VLTRDAPPAELLAGVHLLAAGQVLLPAGAMRRLLHELPAHPRLEGRVAERFRELTDREREIVALAATGLTNAEIAERLVISTATAKTHVSHAMIKLHARHRAQLVALAHEAGLARTCLRGRPPHSEPVTAPTASCVVELAGCW
jgi:DNA-binding NarL/FixJ family response regulator